MYFVLEAHLAAFELPPSVGKKIQNAATLLFKEQIKKNFAKQGRPKWIELNRKYAKRKGNNRINVATGDMQRELENGKVYVDSSKYDIGINYTFDSDKPVKAMVALTGSKGPGGMKRYYGSNRFRKFRKPQEHEKRSTLFRNPPRPWDYMDANAAYALEELFAAHGINVFLQEFNSEITKGMHGTI